MTIADYFGFSCKPNNERRANKLELQLVLAYLAYEGASCTAFKFSGQRDWVILYYTRMHYEAMTQCNLQLKQPALVPSFGRTHWRAVCGPKPLANQSSDNRRRWAWFKLRNSPPGRAGLINLWIQWEEILWLVAPFVKSSYIWLD